MSRILATKPDWIERATLLIAAAIIAWQLFIPPVVGLANNGDFSKVTGGFDLGAPTEDEYKFAPTTYTVDPSRHLVFDYYSSEVVLISAAVALNRIIGAKTFDVRLMGAVHGTLYLAAFWLVLPLLRTFDRRSRVTCSILLIVIYCDVLYVSALNSFYMDTAALVFFMLSAVLTCRILRWGRRSDAIWFVVCCVGFIASKTQHAILGFLIVLMIALQPAVFLPGIHKALRGVVLAALVAVTIFSLNATPWDYRFNPLFSEVFYAILPKAKDPERELKILGLDASYRKYIGSYAYSDPNLSSDAVFVRGFLDKVRSSRLALYLLTHPALACELVVQGLSEAGRQRVDMGNFDRSAGRPEMTESYAFPIWSSLKRGTFEHRGVLYLSWTLVTGVALIFLLAIRRNSFPPGTLVAGCSLAIMMLAAMLIATLGDALDFVRHSFLFIGISDAVLSTLVIAGISLRS